MFGMVVVIGIYVWLMIHRFRLEYAQAQLEAKGLDLALAERRAEATAGALAAPERRAHRRRHHRRDQPDATAADPQENDSVPDEMAYVWASYALVVAVLAGYAVVTIRARPGAWASSLPPDERRWM
jgi:hypothetical protein